LGVASSRFASEVLRNKQVSQGRGE
jgi:hypothetical protein